MVNQEKQGNYKIKLFVFFNFFAQFHYLNKKKNRIK